jgi:heme-degrading monooxygenase HmoA
LAATEETAMFIAMNRFQVRRGAEQAFEQVWLTRDSYLQTVPGFIVFHLLKGPQGEQHTLYSSHSMWQNREAFENWTTSDAFRSAHREAGENRQLYVGHPQFEGFEVRQTVLADAARGV